MLFRVILTFVICYLLGNLNGSILISRIVAHDDVRTHGSGNAGLTNFTRNYGGKSTIAVLVIDLGKAIAACLIGKALLSPLGLSLEGTAIGALAVGIGHDFPCFFGFHGGKGIVCGAGAFLMLDWRCIPLAFLLFLIINMTTGYVSLGSMVATTTCFIIFTYFHYDHIWAVIPSFVMCLLAVYMHRENIIRLLHGTERKTFLFRKGAK